MSAAHDPARPPARPDAPTGWRAVRAAFVSRRMAAMWVLAFSSGLPLGLTAGALQAWLTVAGVDIATIGYFALVGLPYVLKFVWAPLLDRFEPPWGGRRRGWILTLQGALALMCLLMAELDPRSSVQALALTAVLMAWLSASQDVVIDAYRADLLAPHERGAGAGLSVLGYRMAMLVSGGLVLVVADQWLGWPGTYRLMAGVFALLALATPFWPALRPRQGPDGAAEDRPGAAGAEWRGFLAMVLAGALTWWLLQALIGRGSGGVAAAGGSDRFVRLALDSAVMLATGVAAFLAARRVGFPSFIGPWDAFFLRRHAALLLLLIVLYKLGDAFAGSLTTTFLLRGVGFSQTEVGVVNKSVGMVATLVGALLGGVLLTRLSLWQALLGFGLLQAVSNLGYWALAVLPRDPTLMAAVIGLENLCGGLGTAAFLALLMALTDARFSATQYALLSALSAIGRVYVGPVSGVMVEGLGWPTFYLWSVVTALPGLALLVWLRRDIDALQPAPGTPIPVDD